MNRESRQAVKQMSGNARKAWEVLSVHEKDGFVAVPDLCLGLEQHPITFLTFSCLGTYKGKEELKLNLLETFFFRKFLKPSGRLFEELSSAGVTAQLIVILPDTEPRETWGWGIPQHELTECCRMMVEDAAASLPFEVEVVLWCDLAQQVTSTYAQALEWAEKLGPPLLIRAEADHIRISPAFSEIALREKPTRVATRQVAAYAWQGKVLEQLFPFGIFVQSEFPAERKDRMYQPLRSKTLPIVHPFEM